MPFDVNLQKYTFPTPVKILMLVGQYTNPALAIDTTIDKNLISNLLGAKPEIVEATSIKKVIDALDDNEFDILIFAGHSSTLRDGSDAVISLTDTFNITIEQIQNEIRKALNRRNHPLVLAIFNSCDGLGVDSRLTDLNIKIPYLIAMKERITDPIAHRFLELFVRYFFKKRMSLEKAYQQAQNGLHFLFPGADFFPILCLKTAIMPDLFWPSNIAIFISKLWRRKNVLYVGLSIIVLIFIVLGNTWNRLFIIPPPVTQDFCKQTNLNIYISCGEKSLFEDSLPNDKGLGIKAFENKTYSKAVVRLKSAFEQERSKIASEQKKDKNNDEHINHYETGIFLENAKALEEQKETRNLQIFPIAVVIPSIDKGNKELYLVSKAILQGVYNQQEDFNKKNTNNRLLVVIANDDNDAGQAGQDVAKELVERNVLAAIGPYSSKVAFYTKSIYDKKIVLISYAATATSTDYDGGERHVSINLTENSPFFFRVCSTNRGMVEALAKVFHNQNYNNLRLFSNAEDIFSGSFGKEFLTYWKDKRIYQNKQIIPIEYLVKITDETRKEKIDGNLKNAKNQQIGIILCPGAYTKVNNRRDTRKKDIENAQYILRNYGGQVLIGGCNVITTYKDDIKQVQNLNKIVVGVPWFYDPKNTTKEFEQWRSKWEEQKVNFQTDSFMRMVLAQDAAMVLTEALSSLSLNGKASSIELQKYLADPNHKFQGITGEISFTGSDRSIDTSKVITPKCERQECDKWNGEWEIVKDL
jgi:ABC-type branched-subunit amino acid transport system substrate-binding protein